MKQHWKELQPIDSFMVKTNGILHPHDQKIIDLLYQPLIGPISTSLYKTLWHQVIEHKYWSEEWNHYHLMNGLDTNLKEIYRARIKLEGMGLLKTYMKKNSETRDYVYELQPPLSAEQFFTDGMLNIYLYQKVGQAQFLKLKKHFFDQQLNLNDYEELTSSFQDVFSSLGMNSLTNEEAIQASSVDEGNEYFNRKKQELIYIPHEQFDFDLLFTGLSEIMVPRTVFTDDVKDAISKLSFIYGINAVDMKNIVLSSLTAEQKIDEEQLRKAARDWYQLENGAQLPQLVDKHQPPIHRELVKEPKTQEEKLVFYLETVSPRQLLIDLSDGGEPALGDLQAVEDVMFHQKLLPGVTNVLIHYVMLKTDMKLGKNYLEKIASHWSRKKIRTVQKAMELAKSEHRQYQQWANTKQEPSAKRTRVIRTEKLPDWFVSKEEPTAIVDEKEDEERRKRLEAIKRKYQQHGGEEGGVNQ